MKKLILLNLLLAACTTCPQVYVEVGAGVWANQDAVLGDTPGAINAYCEKGNYRYGVFHSSDVFRGTPFNDKRELSTDKVLILYRKKLGGV